MDKKFSLVFEKALKIEPNALGIKPNYQIVRNLDIGEWHKMEQLLMSEEEKHEEWLNQEAHFTHMGQKITNREAQELNRLYSVPHGLYLNDRIA